MKTRFLSRISSSSRALKPLSLAGGDRVNLQALGLAPAFQVISSPSASRTHTVCSSSSNSSWSYGTANDDDVEKVRKEIEMLEQERLQASARGESLARKAQRLTERMLVTQETAFGAVQRGEDDLARSLLQTKAQIGEVLERTSERSRANLQLAAKLEEVIGKKQTELIALLARTGKIKIDTPRRDSSSASAPSDLSRLDDDELDSKIRSGTSSPSSSRRPEPPSPSSSKAVGGGASSNPKEKLWEDPVDQYDSLERKFKELEKDDLREKQAQLERLWRASGQSDGEGPGGGRMGGSRF